MHLKKVIGGNGRLWFITTFFTCTTLLTYYAVAKVGTRVYDFAGPEYEHIGPPTLTVWNQ